MVTEHDNSFEIQMDSSSEDDSEMEIDEVYSSDTNIDERNSCASSVVRAMKNGTALDFFELSFDENIIDRIVEETNEYKSFKRQ